MQQTGFANLRPFRNLYCSAVECGLSEFCKVEQIAPLSDEELMQICEYVIAKNKQSGVKELFLKLPKFINIFDLFEKYELTGKVIISGLQIESIESKFITSGKIIIEIESLADFDENVLNKLAHFVGDYNLPVLLNLGDNLEEVGKVANKYKMSPTELAESFGFLDRKCYARGLNFVDKDDQLLLKNYDVTLILSPRSDGEEGKGFVNNYNLIYHDLSFGFGSGKCYNVDMLAEGKLSILNTSNLMNESGLVKCDKILDALSCETGEIQIPFDEDALFETILDKKVNLLNIDESLKVNAKKIAQKLKEKN